MVLFFPGLSDSCHISDQIEKAGFFQSKFRSVFDKEAKKNFEAKDYLMYEKELKRVQKLLNELMGSLDHRFPISRDLLQLYSFTNRRVIDALFKREPELLDTVVSVIGKLRVGFEGVAKEDKSAPVMGNTQKLYAGLTYGKHALNEVFVNGNEANRGFRKWLNQ